MLLRSYPGYAVAEKTFSDVQSLHYTLQSSLQIQCSASVDGTSYAHHLTPDYEGFYQNYYIPYVDYSSLQNTNS